MGLLFGVLLGCIGYTSLCKWLAHKVEQEIRGSTLKVSLHKGKPAASKHRLET